MIFIVINHESGNESDDLTNFDIFGSLTEVLVPADNVGRKHAWDVNDVADTSSLSSSGLDEAAYSVRRKEFGTRAIVRTNKLSRLSNKGDHLLETERLLCKAHSDLATEFMNLSDLEGNSNMGHVSASFDSSSYGKSLQKYASSRSLTITQEFLHVFSNIRMLARYRESIRSTISHRENYKKQLKSRQSHLKEAKMKSEKATKHAKELAELFAIQSSNKSPIKGSKSSDSQATVDGNGTGPITLPESGGDEEEKKTSKISNSSSDNNSLPPHSQKFSLSTSTIMNLVSMVSDKVVGKNDAMAPVNASQVFNAQAASAKAIKDVEKAETSLYNLGKEADFLQERLESDLLYLEELQRRELQNKLVEFIKLRTAASKTSAQIWEDFGSRLESFGGDSLAHGTMDKFL